MNSINKQQLSAMLQASCNRLTNNIAQLNALDSETGDGDHGSTMLKVVHCIQARLAASEPEQDWQQLVEDIGWSVMGQDGGSAGMLMGSLFTGLAADLNQPALDAVEFGAALQAAQERIQAQSGARPGDKTLLDALLPAVSAYQQIAATHADFSTCLAAAAAAAEEGAESTRSMVAKRGRAKNLGERTLGHIDPGAVSISLIFSGFLQATQE